MTETMMWIFGLLAFLFLFFLGGVWFLNTGVRHALPKPASGGGVSKKDITELAGGLEEIKTRLTSIETLLKSVE